MLILAGPNSRRPESDLACISYARARREDSRRRESVSIPRVVGFPRVVERKVHERKMGRERNFAIALLIRDLITRDRGEVVAIDRGAKNAGHHRRRHSHFSPV